MQKERILEELEKCSKDPIYFITNYVKIVHPIRGIVPFNLYNFQKRIVTEIDGHRFNVIKKFRQAGVTTIMCAYSLWKIIFEHNKLVMVVSIGDRESTTFLTRVVGMYDDLPSWMQPKVKEKNKHNLILTTGSRIRSQPAGAGRSEAVSLLIVDEAAFIDRMREFWAAVYPTLSTGGDAVLLSTVNGMSNLYYELYNGAVKGQNTFNVIDIHWKEHPEYTEEWAEEMRPALGERMWRQEYECAFLGTGENFLDTHTLTVLNDNINPDYVSMASDYLRVWKSPEQYHTYVLCADPSFGRGRDHSAFHIINLYNGEQVAEFYSNKTSIKDFAKIIKDEATKYNTAYVVVERNNLGIALIQELWDNLEYDNLWADEKNDIGILVNAKNREIILSHLEEGLRTTKFRVNSERTLMELNTFIISDSGKIEADDGYNDDLVMSLAMGIFAAKQIINTSPIAIETIDNKDRTEHNPIFLTDRKATAKEKLKEYMKWLMND